MTVTTRSSSKLNKNSVTNKIADTLVIAGYDKNFAEKLYQDLSENVKDIMLKTLHSMKFDIILSSEIKRLVHKVLLYIYLDNGQLFDVRRIESFSNLDNENTKEFKSLLDLVDAHGNEPYEFFTCPPKEGNDKEVENLFYILLDTMTTHVFQHLQFYKCNPRFFMKYMSEFTISSTQKEIQEQVKEIFSNFDKLKDLPCNKPSIQDSTKSLKVKLKLSNKKFKSN